jgi:hypothetical protein
MERESGERCYIEGNDYETYAVASLLPNFVVNSDIHKTAMKLICCKQVDIMKVATAKKRAKKRRPMKLPS